MTFRSWCFLWDQVAGERLKEKGKAAQIHLIFIQKVEMHSKRENSSK